MEINRAEQRQCNREQRSSVHNMNNAVTASLHNSLGQKILTKANNNTKMMTAWWTTSQALTTMARSSHTAVQHLQHRTKNEYRGAAWWGNARLSAYESQHSSCGCGNISVSRHWWDRWRWNMIRWLGYHCTLQSNRSTKIHVCQLLFRRFTTTPTKNSNVNQQCYSMEAID